MSLRIFWRADVLVRLCALRKKAVEDDRPPISSQAQCGPYGCILLPLPLLRERAGGEGLSPMPGEKTLTLTLSRRTGRGDRSRQFDRSMRRGNHHRAFDKSRLNEEILVHQRRRIFVRPM